MNKSLDSIYYFILIASGFVFLNTTIIFLDFASFGDNFIMSQLGYYYDLAEIIVIGKTYYLFIALILYTFLNAQIREPKQNQQALMTFRRKHKNASASKAIQRKLIVNGSITLSFYVASELIFADFSFITLVIFSTVFDINFLKVLYLQLIIDPESKSTIVMFLQLDEIDKSGDSLKKREGYMNKPIVGEKDKDDMGFVYHQTNGTTIEEGNPQRGTSCTGSSGAGKTWSIIYPRIIQTFWKSTKKDIGYSMCTYDFKFPDLSLMSNYMYFKMKSENKTDYPFQMHNICFAEKQLLFTSRFNPLASLNDKQEITNAITVFLESISKSFINAKDVWPNAVKLHMITVALYLKSEFPTCFTLPHILTFCLRNFTQQFKILNLSDDLDVKLSINALNEAINQGGSEAMVNSVSFTISTHLNKFIDNNIFYVLTGSDFKDLQINRVDDPMHLNIGNNEKLKPILSPIISFIFNTYFLLNNEDDCRYLHTLVDEAPTVNLRGIEDYINTARSRGGAVTLARQSEEQEIYQYTKDVAAIINGSLANTYTGQCKNSNIANETSALFGTYNAESISQNLGKNGSMSISDKEKKIIKPEEVKLLSKGYFLTAVAEGEIDSKRAMGKHDVSMYSDIYENYNKVPLKLGPEVYRQVKKGNINKSLLDSYYNADPKSKESKAIQNEINCHLVTLAKTNRMKINNEIDSIFEIL